MKLDLYRRTDGALVVVPARFEQPPAPCAILHFVRSVEIDLALLDDALVLEIGLQGHAIATGADAALLRNRGSELMA